MNALHVGHTDGKSVPSLEGGPPVTLPSVDTVDAMPSEALPGFLLRLNTLQSELTSLQSRATLRLVAQGGSSPARPEPYTLAEGAALLRKSRAWLRRLARGGGVPCAQKFGRSWVFPRDDFDRWRRGAHIGA